MRLTITHRWHSFAALELRSVCWVASPAEAPDIARLAAVRLAAVLGVGGLTFTLETRRPCQTPGCLNPAHQALPASSELPGDIGHGAPRVPFTPPTT